MLIEHSEDSDTMLEPQETQVEKAAEGADLPGYTTMEKDTPRDINHNSTADGNLTLNESDFQMRDVRSDSDPESDSELHLKVLTEARQIAGEIFNILDETTDTDGGIVTNEYLAEANKFLTFAQQHKEKVMNDPTLSAKVAERQALTLPSSPETIDICSGDEGDDEEEDGMEESDFDWDAPEEKEEEDSDSVFEWDNPTPPTSPDDDGHGCCQGQDQCQEDNFCHFPGPGAADFVPCICISDTDPESGTESSVLYLGEQEIQEVITVRTSTSSEGSGRPTPPTPGTPGPEAGISPISTSHPQQPQPPQPADDPRQQQEFRLGDESDIPYETDPENYIDRNSFYLVKKKIGF